MPNIKFKVDRAPYKKGDVIEATEHTANLLKRSKVGSVEETEDKATVNGEVLNKRQDEDRKKEAARLKKKAEDLAK